MTNYTFDTLEASKRLREAGMAEGVAEAVVAVFQHATTGLDLNHLATKADITVLREETATKGDISGLATKTDLSALQAEIKRDVAVQSAELRLELSQLELRAQKRSDQQMWGIIGLLSGVIALATTAIKLLP